MRRFASLVVLLAAVFGVSACGGTGSGDLVSQQRTVGPFDSVRIDSALNVELVVDPSADHSVSVTYDDNVIDQITTQVEGNTLVVELDQKITLSGSGLLVMITMSTLRDLTVSSAVNLKGTGETDSYQLTVSGASDVDLGGITANDVALEVTGVSDVRVHATGSVTGAVSGTSEVTVIGGPTNVTVDTGSLSDLNVES